MRSVISLPSSVCGSNQSSRYLALTRLATLLRPGGVLAVIGLAKDAFPGVGNIGSPAATCNGSVSQPSSSYFASADPVTQGVTGLRFFAVDTRARIFQSVAPVPNPLTPSPTVVPVQ